MFDNMFDNTFKNEFDKIKSKTASIILTNGVTASERRIATKDPNDPNDLTPESTLEEAIKIGFNTTEKEGLLYWVDDNLDNEVPIHETVVKISYDEETANEIQTQLTNLNDNRVYNVTLKSGMTITITAKN
ncbi:MULTISPECIES: hypothetical protein [Bacillus]|uniref:hypothetical protein n=2 Tax=Bacillus TaxID=1386 RepID=UPI000BF8F898|nr:hypothetical protein [Bacillus mycoides]PGA03217.1 hypothetical protein COL71_29720 [Bacillus mycoides]HDR7568250.1 hypothetical protein [Bacillus mycoides]HDR7619267.1 hypothetical protein [Bacillus mycoides]